MTDYSRFQRNRLLLGLVICSFLFAGCSKEEEPVATVSPKRPEGTEVNKEKMRLVGYGVGRNDTEGRDLAETYAMRSLAQQASGVTFRYEKESGGAKLKMHTTAYISKSKIEKEVQVGNWVVIVLSGDMDVESVENAKLVELKKVLTCKPEELSEKVLLTVADVAAEVVKKEFPDAESKEGWVYLTNMLLDVSEDKASVEAALFFKVMLGV